MWRINCLFYRVRFCSLIGMFSDSEVRKKPGKMLYVNNYYFNPTWQTILSIVADLLQAFQIQNADYLSFFRYQSVTFEF